MAQDNLKSRICSRYVLQVKRAILNNNRQTDPKLNSKLAAVIAEASKMNVPKATIERAIERSANMKVFNVNLEIQGPNQSAIICRCETESAHTLRRDIKKILKKFDANLLQDQSLVNMFKSQGFIRTLQKTRDGRDISQDYAEDAAITANAEEVEEEILETSDNETVSYWVFKTDAESLDRCKGELEKLGFEITSFDLELEPWSPIKFGEGTLDKVIELEQALREMEQVVDVFHNVAKQ